MGRPRQFTVDSVERALDIHVPGSWRRVQPPLDLTRSGHKRESAAYEIDLVTGPLHLRTLKEAFAFVSGFAEAKVRYARESK